MFIGPLFFVKGQRTFFCGVAHAARVLALFD
jgi:hypothetical protein